MTLFIVRSIHLLLMALWMTSVVQEIFEALVLPHTERADPKVRAAHSKRTESMGILSGMGTIGTGLWMIWLKGGFSAVPWPIHVGLALSVVMALVAALGLGRTWHRIGEALNEGAPSSSLVVPAQRLKAWGLVLLVLWLAIFFLMVFRHVIQ